MTNLEPLWRRMAGELLKAIEPKPLKCVNCGQETSFAPAAAQHCEKSRQGHAYILTIGAKDERPERIASALAERLAGVLGAAQAVPIAFGKYHYGDTGQYAALLEATNLLRAELARLLKGEG